MQSNDQLDDIKINIIHSHYFGNLVCPHVAQDRLQATSTPRMAFHQEREDDNDMSSMHMTMLGDRGRGDQRGCPNREGGSKLIQFESPRWRPKSSSSSFRVPEPVCHKTGHTDMSGLRFRRSTYGWKAN